MLFDSSEENQSKKSCIEMWNVGQNKSFEIKAAKMSERKWEKKIKNIDGDKRSTLVKLLLFLACKNSGKTRLVKTLQFPTGRFFNAVLKHERILSVFSFSMFCFLSFGMKQLWMLFNRSNKLSAFSSSSIKSHHKMVFCELPKHWVRDCYFKYKKYQ